MHTRPPKKIQTAIPKRPYLPLVLCFIAPALYSTDPPYALLTIASLLAFAALAWAFKSDPWESPGFPGMLVGVLCLKALGFSLLSSPGLPHPDLVSLGVGIVYILLVYLIPLKAAKRVQRLEQEYYAYSQPSKKMYVDIDVRHGQLNSAQAEVKWNSYIEEGLYYKRLTRVANLLIHEAIGVFILFLLFGMRDPYMLLLSLAATLATSFTLTRICSRA